MNVFSRILHNRLFLLILFSTTVLQVLIVEFGNVAFGLSPDGLSLANWGLSILLGTGSLVVGFLLRFLPTSIVPLWILGAKKVSPSTPAIVEISPSEKQEGPIRVSDERSFEPSVRSSVDSPKLEATLTIEPLLVRSSAHEEHLLVHKGRRNSKRDPGPVLLMDPRRVREAQFALARQNSSNHHTSS